MTQTTITRTGAHRPRSVGFLKLHESAGWRLKFYGIAASGERPRPELVRTAELLVPTALPQPAAHSGGEEPHDMDRYGVGFVIVHDAPDYAYALYDWWAGESEIHQRIFSALPNRLGAMRPHPTPAIGSARELAVTDFERRAWLRHVLANDDGADIDAYLAERFEGEV
ncbi:hypothetical protein [Actinoallomurus rhizosphaericola]|uniref:hypothetical protein n=1 Tax=Actinoallomurus rhizosphaericola TaxID=2952536 RepID=UPI002092D5B0|nr:hypothetical protein [Actinoallomurus rhizosphaericola]MCO5995432.1 hypothetical protein [Actinoallomurus rhizosphaericola]